MIRKAFKMYLKAGCADEYEKRHNELWPEMKAMIHESVSYTHLTLPTNSLV